MNSDINSNKNPEEKHWSHVDFMWCTYHDKDRTQIKNVYQDVAGDKYPPDAIRVPAKRLNWIPDSEELYVQCLTLSSLDDLYRLTHRYDTAIPKPLYRGQSNYSWKLETQLEREVPEFVLKDTGLERYELKVISDSQRRFHEFFSQLPDEEDHLSWLALLRYRGVPTRLLDVTRSFYIACYFAIRDAQPGVDAAVWIFSQRDIESSFRQWSYGANKTWLRNSIFTISEYNESLSWPFPKKLSSQYSPPTIEALKDSHGFNNLNYAKTIDAAMRGYVDKPGVAIVEPFWLSRRLDFQQGAFLVPFNVRYDFEYNLFHMLDMFKIETVERVVPTDEDELLKLLDAKIIKLRIPVDLHNILKIKLDTMNIRDLTLFPDIDGALAHLTSIVPRENK